jgi:hypothetical protein
MAKTKTFGVRLTPDLISELERLKDAFAFTSSGEMIESWIRLLQDIDKIVVHIDKHPREWNAQDLKKHFGMCDTHEAPSSSLDPLVLRRIRGRFGEDGERRILSLLQELTRRQHA